MLTIRDLIDQFEIQGAYQIATWDNETDERKILAEGYEIAGLMYDKKYLDAEIMYMFADNNVIVIEIDI